MGIFQRLKKQIGTVAPKQDAAPAKKTTAPKEAVERVIAPKEKVAAFAHLLHSPRVSEKAAALTAKGTYVFNVPVSANKIEIKKAIEALYKVQVLSVRTVRGQGKIVRRGRMEGQRNRWKKALVSLKTGQKIDLYAGV